MAGETPAAPGRLELLGIHHLKLPVSDLAVSLDFYERALAALRIPEADHRSHPDGSLYAYILSVPGLGALLELRLDLAHAPRRRPFDPVTVAVADRASLDTWAAHLTAQQVPHSPVITAIQAWLIVLQDPDGNRLRLYTLQTHGPELLPDEDDPWLRS